MSKFSREKVMPRYFAIAVVLTLLGFAILGKAMYIMTAKKDYWTQVASRLKRDSVSVKPNRGNILSCDGQLMASSIPEYKVYVDLFSNCDPTIATKWFCTVRYNGELLENKIGDNPASGVYEIGAMEDYWDEEIDCNSDGSCGLTNLVMVFSVPTSKSAKAGVRLPEPPEIPLPKQCKERTKIIPRSK